MAFGGLVPSSIMNLIAGQQRQRDPNQPWSEQTPAITPVDTTRPIGSDTSSPQLDASNLAGPVATNLSGPAPTPIIPAFTRGNDIQGADTGDAGSPDSAPSKFTPPVVASPSNVSAFNLQGAPDWLKVAPAVTDPTKTPEGRNLPVESTYTAGVDSQGNRIGKGSRFGAAFQATQGGLVDKLLGGFFGLVDPAAGNRAAFNRDMGRFAAQKKEELAQLDADPVNKARIQYGVQSGLIPMETQRYINQQKAVYGLKGDLQSDKYDRIENLQDTKDTAAQDRLQARLDSNETMKNLALNAAAQKNVEGAAYAVATANGRTEVTPADRAVAGKMIQQFDQSKTDKNVAQTDTAKATTDLRKAQTTATQKLGNLRDKQGTLIDDKIANPQNYYRGMTGDALFRAQIGDYNDALKGLDREENQLYNDRRAGVIKKPADFDAKLADIKARRQTAQQAKSEAAKQIISADATKANRGAAGQTLSTGHKAGDTVTVGGKQVRITKVHPDGKTFDYEEIK